MNHNLIGEKHLFAIFTAKLIMLIDNKPHFVKVIILTAVRSCYHPKVRNNCPATADQIEVNLAGFYTYFIETICVK